MKRLEINAILLWLIIAFGINYLIYKNVINNGFSDQYKIFLSEVQRKDPNLFFWELLPKSLMIFGIFVLPFYIITKIIITKKSKRILK